MAGTIILHQNQNHHIMEHIPSAPIAENKSTNTEFIDGGANTTLYVKESGTGNTGWIAK